jgi:hypothetical protein
VARAAGLIAVAVLPAIAGITGDSYLHPAVLAHGFKTAAMIAAVFCAAGGVLAFATIRNPPRLKGAGAAQNPSYCALDSTPLTPAPAPTSQLGLPPAPRISRPPAPPIPPAPSSS